MLKNLLKYVPQETIRSKEKIYNTCNHPYIIRINCNLQNTGKEKSGILVCFNEERPQFKDFSRYSFGPGSSVSESIIYNTHIDSLSIIPP